MRGPGEADRREDERDGGEEEAGFLVGKEAEKGNS